MTMNYETQDSWAKQWEEEQLAKLIEETKQYIKNRMLNGEEANECEEKWI